MTTVNISITADQAKFVDELIVKHDFGNRSEFFRNIIRLIKQRPEIVSASSILPFSEPSTRSRSKIYQAVSASGKYSKDFLADLKSGLEDSRDFFYEE